MLLFRFASLRTSSLAVSGLLLATVAGCGGGAAVPPPTTAEKPAVATKSAPPTTAAATPTKAVAAEKPAQAGGRKFVGDIPYDVFFDDPLGVVADSTQVAAPAETMATKPTVTSPAPTDAAPAASGGATAWGDYLTGEEIQSEVKRIRNHLNSSLQSLGQYNGNVKEIAVDGAVVAGLAWILSETPDEATWKKNAGLVETYGSQIWETASGANSLGKEPFEKVQASSERLLAVLSGNVPADAETPPADRSISDVAHRKGLMRRIQKASEYLRANINTDVKLKSEQETILQEAALIAAFGKACALPAYESADEEDYQKYAKALIDGAIEARDAAKSTEFDKFQGGINKIQKACNDCHADYGTGG